MGRRPTTLNEGFFYWVARDAWVTDQPVNGKTKRLTLVYGFANKEAARQAFYAVLKAGGIEAIDRAKSVGKAQPAIPASGPTVSAVVNLYLDAETLKKTKIGRPASARVAQEQLKEFSAYYGTAAVNTLCSADIDNWIYKQAGWESPATRNNVRKRIKTCLNWAIKNNQIKENPLHNLEAEETGKTRRPFTQYEINNIRKAAREDFKEFFDMLLLTGVRPCELANVTAENTTDYGDHLQALVKGKLKGVSNVLFFNEAAEIVRILINEHPDGYLFQTFNGGKWTHSARDSQFQRIRQVLKLSKMVKLYCTRHTFATESIKRGVSTTLIGMAMNTSPAMIAKTYGQATHMDAAKALASAWG